MKKVITKQKQEATVDVSKIDKYSIFAYEAKNSQTVMKLTCIDKKYGFTNMFDSAYLHIAEETSVEDAIKTTAQQFPEIEIYQFDNKYEFLEFCNKVVGG